MVIMEDQEVHLLANLKDLGLQEEILALLFQLD